MSEPIQSIATNNYLLATPIGSGYMETSALEFDGDKISGYAGSAFKAGDEFPQSATEAIEVITGTSATWNGTTDTVSSNSGAWGGSALPLTNKNSITLENENNALSIGVASDFIVTTTETIGSYSVGTSDVKIEKSFSKAGYRPIAWKVRYSFSGVINFNDETSTITNNSLKIYGYAHALTGSYTAGFSVIITWVRI